ncbi:MAG: hypothetical protein KF803_18670 [Cyclobacteriaceae bacterium]|nr:hypothetical protein [Cyclobacteriaceae bacterium]
MRAIIESIKKSKPTFYEDEQFIVSKTCSGEWGGTIKFKSKKNGVEYSCSATCPISVYKLGDKYYVTSSLGHMSGSCEVVEISNPELMEIYKTTPPRKVKGKKVKYVGDDESKSKLGTKKLIGEHGKIILGSFVFNGQLFHVVMERERKAFTTTTYIATIEEEKFRAIKLITNEDVFTYDRDILKTNGGHMLIPISGGYLNIFENQIKILK